MLNSAEMELIVKNCKLMLEHLPNTEGQCVAVSAFLSDLLGEAGLESYVALGSLSCRGVKTFEYSGPISTDDGFHTWDGHAWVVIKSLLSLNKAAL